MLINLVNYHCFRDIYLYNERSLFIRIIIDTGVKFLSNISGSKNISMDSNILAQHSSDMSFFKCQEQDLQKPLFLLNFQNKPLLFEIWASLYPKCLNMRKIKLIKDSILKFR